MANSMELFFFVPCILIILKFFSPTNAHFINHMLLFVVFLALQPLVVVFSQPGSGL
jgi:hypothetical protein